MAQTFSQRLEKVKKERGTESSLSSSVSKPISERIKGRWDTLADDEAKARRVLTDAYSHWQNADALAKNKEIISSMSSRLKSYKTSTGKTSEDLDKLIESYDSALSNWDSLGAYYGQYKNAVAFDAGVAKNEWYSKNKGLTFDEVQERLKNADKMSAEYKYLSEYGANAGYSNLSDYDKELAVSSGNKEYSDKLNAKRNEYALKNAFNEYSGLINNDDFFEVARSTNLSDAVDRNVDLKAFANLSESQRLVAQYIYAKQGKDALKEYVRKIGLSNSYEKAQSDSEAIAGWLDGHPIREGFATTYSYLAKLANAPLNALQTIQTLNGTYNPYSGPAGLNYRIDKGREQVAKDVAEATEGIDLFGENVPSFLYQTTNSIVDSYLGAMIYGSAYAPIMGTMAYSSAYAEALEKGAGESKAQLTALASGAAETLFEWISLDKLLKNKNAVDLKTKIVNTLKQAFTEGSEEVHTEIANIISDAIINGGNSDYGRQIAMLRESGYSEEEISKIIFADIRGRITESAIGGALSGGVMGGIESERQSRYLSEYGKNVDIESLRSEIDNTSFADELSKLEKEYDGRMKSKEYYAAIADIADRFETDTNERVSRLVKEYTKPAKGKGLSAKRKKMSLPTVFGLEEKTRGFYVGKNTTADGKRITISNVNVEDGKISVVDTDGNTHSVKDIELSPADALMVGVAGDIPNADIRSAYVKNYHGENIDTYTNAFNYIWKSSTMTGEDYSLSEIVKELSGRIPNGSIANIYETFKTFQKTSLDSWDANIAEIEKVSNGGEFTDDTDYESLTYEEKQLYKFAKTLSLKGINMRVFKDVSATSDNGLYFEPNNTIVINLAARKYFNEDSSNGQFVVKTIAHELTHWMKANASEEYKALEDLIKAHYGEEKWNEFVNRQIDERKEAFDEDVKAGNAKEEDYIPLDRSVAEEEVIARACEDMLDDAKMIEEIFGNVDVEVAQTLKDKIVAWFDNAIKFIKKLMSRTYISNDMSGLLTVSEETLENAKALWLKGINKGIANSNALMQKRTEVPYNAEFESAKVAKSIKAAMGNDFGSYTFDANGEFYLAESKDGNTIVANNALLYSKKTQSKVEDNLRRVLKSKGKDADKIISLLRQQADILTMAAEDYDYSKLAATMDAELTLDVKTGKAVLHSFVKNGEYPINIDFSTICKKREAYMRVIEHMLENGLFDNVILNGETIAQINKILKDNGFETACLGCFVESRRLQIQTWADTFTSEWNDAVREVNPNATPFDFGKGGKGLSSMTKEEVQTLDLELTRQKNKNAKGNINLGKGNTQEKMSRLLDKVPSLAHTLSSSDLLSSDGLASLRALSGDIYSLILMRYGSNTPKPVQGFNPYNGEIADLSGRYIKSIFGEGIKGLAKYKTAVSKDADFIAQYGAKPENPIAGETKKEFDARKKEWDSAVEEEALLRYLYDIGGVRVQSFSDFLIENTLDYFQMVAELDAREMPMHGYTKEIVFARLFGMTGMKINMSLIADVDTSVGDDFIGLTYENGRYDFQWGDYSRHKATDGESYIQSIGYKDAIALQLDPRYSRSVGTIAVGVSIGHIVACLESPYIRMCIPYHASGMNAEFALLMNISRYTNFEDFQNTTIEGYYDKNGNRLEQTSFGKDDAVGKAVSKTYDDFAFNHALQTMNPREAAKAYLEWCNELHPAKKKGVYFKAIPKFNCDIPEEVMDEFGIDYDNLTKSSNYYKLLEDFNVYDCISNEYAPQGAVKATYAFEGLSGSDLAEYEDRLKKSGMFTDAEIKKYVRKAGQTYEDIIREEVKSRSGYHKTQDAKMDSTLSEIEGKIPKRKSVKTKAPTFYSKMSREIEAMKQDKVGASSLIPYLKGKGVKDEEIKWSGLQAFLDGKKSVSKADLIEFANGSMLQIEEKAIGEGEEYISEEDSDKKYTYEEFLEETKKYADEEGYTYTISRSPRVVSVEFYDADGEYVEEISGNITSGTRWKGYVTEDTTNYREILFKLPGADYSNIAMKTHWKEAGVIAHARIDDMTLPNGNKVLFIEEIQSDWHNAGQKDGYTSQNLTEVRKEYDKLNSEYFKLVAKITDGIVSDMFSIYVAQTYVSNCIGSSEEGWQETANHLLKQNPADYREAFGFDADWFVKEINKARALKMQKEVLATELDKVPDAPFKDGKYIEFVMKRLIRMAAEEGYDAIGWTTGKMQEERWSSEYSEGYRIEYDQDMPKFINKYGKAWGVKVERIQTTSFNKEAFKKANEEFDHNLDVNAGAYDALAHDMYDIKPYYDNPFRAYDDEKVGVNLAKMWIREGEFSGYASAEFMLKLVKLVNKSGLKDNIEETRRLYNERLKAYELKEDNNEVWTVPITPAMKESVLYEGQPLYSKKISSKEIVDEIYNDDTITFGFDERFKDLIVGNNKGVLIENLEKRRFESFVKMISEQTKYTENEVWEKIADYTFLEDGIGTKDGKTYVNVHELSEESLKRVIELGGLASPSMAVVDVDHPVTNFGMISLIFPSYIVNPETDPMFYGDAYSTSFPAVAHFMNEDKFIEAVTDGKYKGVVSEEEMYTIMAELKDYSWYDRTQRTASSRLYNISNDGIESLAKEWQLTKSIEKIFKSGVDGYTDFNEFSKAFVEEFFNFKKIYREHTYNPDNAWGSIRHDRFRNYSLDDAVEEITALGEKDFPIATGERINSDDELMSLSARSRLKGKSSYAYYEAKPQRAIYLGDARYAVIPATTSEEIKAALDNEGVKVVEYAPIGDGYNALNKGRIEAINKVLKTDSDVRYSKKTINGGKGNEGYYFDKNGNVVVSEEMFSVEDVANEFNSVKALAKWYLRKLDGESDIIISDNRLVNYDSVGAKEYNGSVETIKNNDNLRYSKANAIIAFREIVRKALNPLWSVNKKTKHNIDAQRGWTYYDISFGIEGKSEITYYGGRLVVRMDADGKDYVYDVDIMNEIKKEAISPSTIQDSSEITPNPNVSQIKHSVKTSKQERIEKNLQIESITREAGKLAKWMGTNSGKAAVPVELQAPIANLLNAIDFSSRQLLGMRNGSANNGMPTQKDISLANAMNKMNIILTRTLNAQANGVDDATLSMWLDLPQGFDRIFNILTSRVNDLAFQSMDNANALQMMTLEELKELNDAIKSIRESVTTMNQLLSGINAHRVDEVGKTTIAESAEVVRRDRENTAQKTMSSAEDFMDYTNGVPQYVFEHLGSGASQMFDEIKAGWGKFARRADEVIEFANAVFTEEQVKAWRNEEHTFDVLVDPAESEGKNAPKEHRTITMTSSQLMSLYCLQKREQARGHIFGGGIVVSGYKLEKGGTVKKQEAVTLTESELDKMMSELTDDQKAVADEIQKYMTTVLSNWGNEISMKRFGILQFGEENYFPIKVNDTILNAEPRDTNKSIYALLNMGFTKALVDNANNEILINDFFSEFTEHAGNMAKYNALALPVLDMVKWFNYKEKEKRGDKAHTVKSVRGSLERAFGNKSTEYIRHLLYDLNGQSERGRGEGMLSALSKGYKISAVAANLQVVALQPLSYARAMYVMDAKYLQKGLSRKPQIEKCQRYSGIALWKIKLGFYDTDISRGLDKLILHTDSLKDKVIDKAGDLAGKADALTWGVLWNACEAEIMDKNPSLAYNSEEFNKKVAERFDDVIYYTQVVDSTITRSDIMRSTSFAVKTATAFMSEPTLALNMVNDAGFKFRQTYAKTKSLGKALTENGKTICRATYTYVVSAVLESALRALIGKWRKPEDDETMIEKFFYNFRSELNVLRKIPLIKEIFDMLDGYKSTRMDTQVLQSTVDAGKAIVKAMSEGDFSYKAVYKLLVAVSQATGLPISNALREVEAIWNNTIARMYPSLYLKR